MADNLGPMAWLFLPENVQVQYLQKIAQMRRKSSGPKQFIPDVLSFCTSTQMIFCTKCNFSAAIEAAHFPD